MQAGAKIKPRAVGRSSSTSSQIAFHAPCSVMVVPRQRGSETCVP